MTTTQQEAPQKGPAWKEPRCSPCDGQGWLRIDGRLVRCKPCDGTGKRDGRTGKAG